MTFAGVRLVFGVVCVVAVGAVCGSAADKAPGALSSKNPKEHWAFKPPVRPNLPEVKNRDWVRNPIDRFILARLEKEGLSPSVQADKVALVRRMYLDLV